MILKHYELNEHEQALANMTVQEFDKYMTDNYAQLFKNRFRTPEDQYIMPMHFGFEIGPGWRHVLDSLCSKLKFIQDHFNVTCVFDQIKEKMGGARFYSHVEINQSSNLTEKEYAIIDDIISTLVSNSEEYCDYICEVIGNNIDPWEKIKLGGWYYGCGLEGFKVQWEDSPDRIIAAEKAYERSSKLHDIESRMGILNDEELDAIEERIAEKEEEIRNKTLAVCDRIEAKFKLNQAKNVDKNKEKVDGQVWSNFSPTFDDIEEY